MGSIPTGGTKYFIGIKNGERRYSKSNASKEMVATSLCTRFAHRANVKVLSLVKGSDLIIALWHNPSNRVIHRHFLYCPAGKPDVAENPALVPVALGEDDGLEDAVEVGTMKTGP